MLTIAKDLLGKLLVTEFEGIRTSGIIVETEAYRGPDDKACHAYNNKRTPRTETMFHEGGVSYVYLIYGIHHLFNVVTGSVDMPHAVLVRGIEPIEGISTMLKRRNINTLQPRLTAGPGSLAKALGIQRAHTNFNLTQSLIWIEDQGKIIHENEIIASPRVGVDYAGEDAKLPWRFRIKNSPYTSPAK